jgi:integrase
MPKPSAALIEAARAGRAKPGRYRDQHGLMLVVGSNSASWIWRYAIGGRRREMGLGSAQFVGLAQARAEALRRRVELKTSRVDPLGEQQRAAARRRAATFDEVAVEFIKAHAPGWKDRRAKATWESTLSTYASPIIGKLAPDEITTEHVMSVLQPHWHRVPETMSRVRGRIESVLDFAKTKNLREGANPAAWKGNLKLMLPSKGKVKRVKHHEALPLDRLPATFAKLVKSKAIAAQAAAFTIACAARPGEGAGACWSEIDLKAAVWVVPDARMKNSREHRVPLSPPALVILQRMARRRGEDRIFPTRGAGVPSASTLLEALREAAGKGGSTVTLHGTSRSCFDDWSHQQGGVDSRLINYALSHYPSDTTERLTGAPIRLSCAGR